MQMPKKSVDEFKNKYYGYLFGKENVIYKNEVEICFMGMIKLILLSLSELLLL